MKQKKDTKMKGKKKDMKMKSKKKLPKEFKESSNIQLFVSALLDRNYKKADAYLNREVNQKIKQKIINNNNNLF
jgi:hypothetical protein